MLASAYNPALALDAADGVIDGRFFGRPIVGGSTTGYNSALALDAADGVIDGRFFGRPIVGASAAPVYKTPFVGSLGYSGLGFAGAIGGISSGYSALGAGAVGGFSGGYSALGGVSSSITRFGAAYAAPYATTSYAAPAATTYAAPAATTYAAPAATSYASQAYCAYAPVTASSTTSYAAAPVTAEVQYMAPQQVQYIEPPVQYVEAPPQVQYVEAPPVVLQLPAPVPPPPAPLPPPPSVIHIKDDSGPKIASLQAEIRRLERLLASAKETEGALRAEIQELLAKIEMWAQKDMRTAALEAELAKLREQLLEAQRRIVFLEGQRDEAHKHIAFLESQLKAADAQIAQMAARIRQLENEIANLRARLEAKTELHSRTNVHETYKVKTFEMAAKLAVMDGTDDGMYNGLPIEVEGEGLYRDLVARGRRPRENVSLTGRPASVTTSSETYKVQSFEMAEKLSRMDGTDNGRYNGLPIEVQGQGLYTEIVRSRRVGGGSLGTTARPGSIGGGFISGSVTGGQTYKVSNMEMAAKISKMGGADDGTYKGLPIEVQGLGLYRELRGRM